MDTLGAYGSQLALQSCVPLPCQVPLVVRSGVFPVMIRGLSARNTRS